ncbi:MAG: hypothetical protein ACRC2H_11795 [Silanimonas sp.]
MRMIPLAALLAFSLGCSPSASIGIDLPENASEAAVLACLGERLAALHTQGLDGWPDTPPLRDRDGRGWLWRNAPGLDESPVRASLRLYGHRLAIRIARDGFGAPRTDTNDPALATLRDALDPCLPGAAAETTDKADDHG